MYWPPPGGKKPMRPPSLANYLLLTLAVIFAAMVVAEEQNMGCRFITDEAGRFSIACGRSPRRTCEFCTGKGNSRPTTKLCDWKVGEHSTCSATMCDEHATNVGVEKDLCPPHNIRWEKIKKGRKDRHEET